MTLNVRALILYRRRRFINHLLTYLLMIPELGRKGILKRRSATNLGKTVRAYRDSIPSLE